MLGVYRLLSVGQEAHEARALDRRLQHLLVFEAEPRVVALADVSEIIDVGLEHGVILVVHVLHASTIEWTNFLLNGALLLLLR